MKNNKLEAVEKVVGSVVVRTGIFLTAMTITGIILEKAEKNYLNKK